MILLAHGHDSADRATGLQYVPQAGLTALAGAEVYDFGDFVWADYPVGRFPAVAPDDLVDLSSSPRPDLRAAPSCCRRWATGAGVTHDDGGDSRSSSRTGSLCAHCCMRSRVGLTSASIEALDRPSESEAIRVTATGVHACRGTFDIDGLLTSAWTEGRDLLRSRIARISSSPAPRRRRPDFTRRFCNGAGRARCVKASRARSVTNADEVAE